MDVDDCYQELGVAPDASDAEVKAAWRRLAARWHPDRNDSPEALRKIQRINQALEEIRRSKRELAAGEGEVQAEPDGPDGPAMQHTIELTIEEIASGCVRELRGEVIEDCADCEGSGQQLHATSCPDCGGTGRVQQALWVAWLSPTVDCGACHGQGTTRQGCMACGASGRTSRSYRCRVQVPSGARVGHVVDVEARVEGGPRGSRVAVCVHVALQPHEFFGVEDDGTLTCELPVDGFAWIANRWIDVPTPRGVQQMRLRRGTLNYRIKAAGLPWQDSGACADCIVTIVPLFPEDFSPEQEALVDRLVATNSGAAGTGSGDRMARWAEQVASWRARMETAAG